MTMELFWYFPTSGDGRYLVNPGAARETNLGYLKLLAQTADELGFAGALIPTGRQCEDSWVVASALIPVTQQLKFLIAVRPGLMVPAVAARMASSFDRLSYGRLLMNVVAGGSEADMAADGLKLDHDARYEMTEEFLALWRQLMTGDKNITHAGKYFQIEKGSLGFPPVQKPYPPLYFGAASDAGQRVAAEHADVVLMWGEPPQQIEAQIAKVRELAAERGRTVRFGIRLHIVVRDTEAEAWTAADELIRYVDDATIERAQSLLGTLDSVGQQRMLALHGGRRDKLIIAPNLWAGVGLVRGGAGTAIVGDPDTVAARIKEYADLGIETFILSGFPHLEEAYRVAESLFPRLPYEPRTPHRLRQQQDKPQEFARSFLNSLENLQDKNGGKK
jgi:alkanesulfonate monooxygenase